MGGAHPAAALCKRRARPLAGAVWHMWRACHPCHWRCRTTGVSLLPHPGQGLSATFTHVLSSMVPRSALPPQLVGFVTHGGRPEVPPREQLPGEDTPHFEGLDAYLDLMQRCWHQVGAADVRLGAWLGSAMLTACFLLRQSLHDRPDCATLWRAAKAKSLPAHTLSMLSTLRTLCRIQRRGRTLQPS